MNISTPTARKKLIQRAPPYWMKRSKGEYLGARKLPDGTCTWIARYTTSEKKHLAESLGNDRELSFEDACRQAEQFFKHCRSGVPKFYTVLEAVKDYQKHQRVHKSENAAKEVTRLMRKLSTAKNSPRDPEITYNPGDLANVKLTKLTTKQISDWLNDLVRATGSDDQIRQSKDTANRILNIFKAALNLAYRQGQAQDKSVWEKVPSFKSVGTNRKLFLSDEQVKRLLANTTGAFHSLLRSLILTGARYGEIAAAHVADFDPREGTLHLDGKTGPRTVYLSDEAIEFLKTQAKGKTAKAPLLMKEDGTHWGADHQIRPMNAAKIKAKLPKDAVIYSLRHYYISKALLSGIPIQVVAENCGTSVAMIEKHYGKFTNMDRRTMMNAVKLGTA